MILADPSLPPFCEPPPRDSRNFAAAATVFASLLLLGTLSGCADDKPSAPLNADEAALKAEQKAAEHRVFYEGWLHPGG